MSLPSYSTYSNPCPDAGHCAGVGGAQEQSACCTNAATNNQHTMNLLSGGGKVTVGGTVTVDPLPELPNQITPHNNTTTTVGTTKNSLQMNNIAESTGKPEVPKSPEGVEGAEDKTSLETGPAQGGGGRKSRKSPKGKSRKSPKGKSRKSPKGKSRKARKSRKMRK